MLSARLEAFLFKNRFREPTPIVLRWRRIYILPTSYGFTFAITLLLLFIGSINYTLSLGYLLTFFLAAVGNVAILQTFSNLRGLRVHWRMPEPVFAGEIATFPLHVEDTHSGNRYAIDTISQEGNSSQPFEVIKGTGATHISLPAKKRGILRPSHVILETRYPLGLFRAWVRIAPDIRCIVYPSPAEDTIPLPSPIGDDGKGMAMVAGDEQLEFLRPYRQGDSPRRIAWHAFARERGLLTKQFAAETSGNIWLDINQVPNTGIEAKLSRLTSWVLDAEAAGIPYGLRLSDTLFPPALGEIHRHRCLEQLALYGIEDGHKNA